MTNEIVIQISGTNDNPFFKPLQRKLRGEFDFNRLASGHEKFRHWPTVPGQMVGIDPKTGVAWVDEPLCIESACGHIVKRLESLFGKVQLAPEREEFKSVHVPTWLFWMKREVERGTAKVIRGTLPKEIDGEPQKHFWTKPPKPDPVQLLADRIGQLCELLAGQGGKQKVA